MNESSQPVLYSKSFLPTEHGDFLVQVFHTKKCPNSLSTGAGEILAISLGLETPAESTFVRVHSACFTSEVLHSTRCDCRAQLDSALEEIQQRGRGVVIYLNQEGRGIGLGNKIKAYALQMEEGLDTVEANRHLGFADDSRDYQHAAAVLKELGIQTIDLNTNNPRKRAALEQAGIRINEVVPSVTEVTDGNLEYLETKKKRLGHTF